MSAQRSIFHATLTVGIFVLSALVAFSTSAEFIKIKLSDGARLWPATWSRKLGSEIRVFQAVSDSPCRYGRLYRVLGLVSPIWGRSRRARSSAVGGIPPYEDRRVDLMGQARAGP